MKWSKWILCVTLIATGGCVTERTVTEREQRAFEQGVAQGTAAAQIPDDLVVFQGSVRNNMIQWREGLTLANGIIEADYYGRRAPRSIRIIAADGEIVNIDPDDLLRGKDFSLKPGDIVELNR